MKIKSLLAAVSMVALAASSAHAIEVDQLGTVFAQPLALELDLAGEPVEGVVSIVITPTAGGNFAQGILQNVIVTLPAGMTFSSVAGNTVSGTDITANGPSATTGTVFDGGAPGSSTVTYQISPNDNMTGSYTVNLPVAVGDGYCAAGEGNGVSAIVALNSGGFVENDSDGDNTNSATGADGFGGCASALDGTVTSDETIQDSFIALGTAPNTYFNLNTAPAPLGSVAYAVDGDVSIDSGATDLPVSAIDEVVTYVTLPGNPAVGGLVVSAADNGGTSVGTVAPSPAGQAVHWTVTTNGAESLAGYNVFVSTNPVNPVAIPNMQPTVVNATVEFTGADFIDEEAGATGNLDALVREGATFGFFDWNAGPAIADPTLSIYRVTGLTNAVNYTIQVENSNNDGLYFGTATPDAAGEAVLVSTTLPVPADTGRYDFEITFESASTQIDVDRLLLRTGIVTDFGGGANTANTSAQPTTDDDNAGSE